MNHELKIVPPRPGAVSYRTVCWVLLAILVAEFWMPHEFARDLHINNRIAHGLFCAITAVAMTETFALRGSRATAVTRRVVQVTVGFLAFAAVLEFGKSFVGRHAAFSDFLFDAGAATLAVLLLVVYRRYNPRREGGTSSYSFFPVSFRGGAARSGDVPTGSFAPGAFLIGAQKAATTSLASLLSQHPGFGVSVPKEPHFFTSNFDRGFDWYRRRFPDRATCLLDASTSYTMAPIGENPAPMSYNPVVVGVPQRIFEIRPDAKFIYMLRDPAARALSAYWHNVREGREDRPLRQALGEERSYMDPSYYFGQLQKYLECFDLDRFLFIRFDDFVTDPLAQASRCAEFLGLDHFPFRLEPPKNKSFQYNALGTWLRDMAGSGWLERISLAVRELTPEWSHGALKRILQSPNPPSRAEDYAWLTCFFQKDLEDFTKLTGISIMKNKSASVQLSRVEA